MALAAGCVCSQAAKNAEFARVKNIEAEGLNSFYSSVQAPMVPQKLVKLPVGSIVPGGWLETQLRLQRNGLNGHLGEISAWLQKENNSWLKSGGEWGWEEVPYWLRGFAQLGYVLNDKDLQKEAKIWIEAILSSQREDGNFGPEYKGKKQDFWPNMIALWILQDYYEYTGDERVIPFMTKYCHYQLTVKDEDFLASYWENSRGGDNLWSVAWLYSRTKDEKLLELADKIHRNTANWHKSTQLPNWHTVNIAQGIREPATWYMFCKDPEMLAATWNAQSLIRRAFGQVPGGMYGADENARIGFFDPRQGTETCAFAEQLSSDEILTMITGDTYWAENAEDIAFNSFPAAFMPDYKSLRYITSPNHVISDSANHRPGIDNGGPFLCMNPFSSRCCQHNHGFGWPYYASHLVMATPDNGAAFVLYSSCSTKMKVSDGTEVTLVEETDYPFDDVIKIKVETAKETSFPIYLRMPSWCEKADVVVISEGMPQAVNTHERTLKTINGKKVTPTGREGDYLRVTRNWKNGDMLVLHLPKTFTYRTWQVNKDSVSVNYGPLTLSLKIKENYIKKESDKTALGDSKWQAGVDKAAWPTWEIHPGSDWNYALDTNSEITLSLAREYADPTNPFTLDTVPYEFSAKGRKVLNWKIDEYGLCGVLPYADAPKGELEDITLVPMGAARLRITAFPAME